MGIKRKSCGEFCYRLTEKYCDKYYPSRCKACPFGFFSAGVCKFFPDPVITKAAYKTAHKIMGIKEEEQRYVFYT